MIHHRIFLVNGVVLSSTRPSWPALSSTVLGLIDAFFLVLVVIGLLFFRYLA